jgi:hypothetical protein
VTEHEGRALFGLTGEASAGLVFTDRLEACPTATLTNGMLSVHRRPHMVLHLFDEQGMPPFGFPGHLAPIRASQSERQATKVRLRELPPRPQPATECQSSNAYPEAEKMD